MTATDRSRVSVGGGFGDSTSSRDPASPDRQHSGILRSRAPRATEAVSKASFISKSLAGSCRRSKRSTGTPASASATRTYRATVRAWTSLTVPAGALAHTRNDRSLRGQGRKSRKAKSTALHSGATGGSVRTERVSPGARKQHRREPLASWSDRARARRYMSHRTPSTRPSSRRSMQSRSISAAGRVETTSGLE